MLYSAPWLVVLLLAGHSQQAGFSSPDFVTSYGSGAFENVAVWYVGQTKKVAYDISDTGLEDYTIALWQQSVSGGAASLGPVVDSVTSSSVSDSFEWVVATDGFDLDTSPVFFFWLFNGSSSDQGNTAFTGVSSAYFNISSDDPPTSSASTSSTSSITTTSSTSTGTTSTTTSDSSSTTAVGDSRTSDSSGNNKGLSTGAGVGIGVGLGLAGICAVICAIIFIRTRKRKVKKDGLLHEMPPYSAVEDKPLQIVPNHSYRQNLPALNPDRPAELNAPTAASPVELYAGTS